MDDAAQSWLDPRDDLRGLLAHVGCALPRRFDAACRRVLRDFDAALGGLDPARRRLLHRVNAARGRLLCRLDPARGRLLRRLDAALRRLGSAFHALGHEMSLPASRAPGVTLACSRAGVAQLARAAAL